HQLLLHHQILDRGFITFGVYQDFAPWSWEEGGKPTGLDVALGEAIADEMGLEARFRILAADETVDDDLRNFVWKGHPTAGGVVNVMLHVPYDTNLACRNELVVFTGQYHQVELAIAYAPEAFDGAAPTPAFFRFNKVGVQNDSIADFYLTGFAGGLIVPKMVRYASTVEAVGGLSRGEVDAVLGTQGELQFGLDQAGGGRKLEIHMPPLAGLGRSDWVIGAAVRHSYRELGYVVDDAIVALIDSGRMAAIFDEHGLSWTRPPYR
ncbi:MAG: transporter substrate-binding domain-containing protein, partial [Pseudomonadota bacterium]